MCIAKTKVGACRLGSECPSGVLKYVPDVYFVYVNFCHLCIWNTSICILIIVVLVLDACRAFVLRSTHVHWFNLPEREFGLLEPLPLVESAHGLLRGCDEVLLLDAVAAHLK